jgi:adenine-specific DNA-methyltransferase
MFLSEVRGLTPTNFWSHEFAGHTDEGTRDLAALIDGKVFDNPKPVRLMKRVLEHATDQSSLVLDFFAGTGTMAQAVLELNAEDGGARRFIAVQIAEECPPGSAAARAGFATIADIGKERIRRAGTAAGNAPHHPRWDADAGFRVLRVDSTNMSDVHRLPDLLAQDDLALLTETVKPGRTAEDVLFEVLIGCGLDLAAPIAAEKVDGREVFIVGHGALIACLARDISPAVVRDIARRSPSRVVFLDSGFATDAGRIDAERHFAQASPATEVRVI